VTESCRLISQLLFSRCCWSASETWSVCWCWCCI